MNASLAKAFGWLQFAANVLPQVFAHGIPTNPIAWIGLFGSLAGAVGIHTAANTDGTK